MATVPVQREYQVAVQPLSPGRRSVPQATPEAFGAAEGRATQGLAQTVSATAQVAGNIALQMQQEDIERQLKKLDVATSEFELQQLVGDEKTPGFLMQKGENALTGRKALDENLAKHQQELLANVSDEKVKGMWSDVYVARKQKTDARINQHYQEQGEVAKDLVSKARITAAVDEAAAGLVVPGEAVSKAAIEAVSMADRAGVKDPEARKQFVAEQTTQVIKAAIVGEIKRGNTSKAQQLFKAYGPGMLGQEQALVQGMLQANQDEEVAQNRADAILGQGLSLTASVAEAHRLYQGAEADNAVRRIEAAYNRQRAELSLVVDNAEKKFFQGLYLGGENKQGVPLKQLMEENPEEAALLAQNSSIFMALQNAEIFRQSGGAAPVASNPETRKAIMTMAPEKFLTYNLAADIPNLSVADRKKFLEEQDALVKASNDPPSEAALDQATEILKTYLPRDSKARVDLKKIPADTIGATIRAMRAWVVDYKRTTGLLPTEEQRQKKAAELATPVVVEGFFSDAYTWPATQSIATPQAAAPAQVKVSSAKYKKVEAFLISRGKQASPERIEAILDAEAANNKGAVDSLVETAPNAE